jgi:uncharacterized protein YndB with AHSA1/START domain
MDVKDKVTITVTLSVDAPIDFVWKCWTTPADIIHWNNASDDWHTPTAINDLRVGGTFNYRMEAKDGSFGFDFAGTYNNIIPNKLIEYTIADGRKVKVEFSLINSHTIVTEIFEAESEHSIDLQRAGWHSILLNFKQYSEKKFNI